MTTTRTTMIITLAEIQTIIHKPGNFFEADGTTADVSRDIRGSNWPSSTNSAQHLPQGTNLLSFEVDVENKAVVIRTLRFRRAAANAGNKIAYLPFIENKITSMIISINDTKISCFITPSLSGSKFFINRLLNGNLVCYHDNALEATILPPLRTYYQAVFGSVSMLASLNSEKYCRESTAAAVAKREERGVTEAEFHGGTIVMGFRKRSGQWEFWFQTYGVIRYKYLDGEKKVSVGFNEELPERIFQCEKWLSLPK